MKIFHFSKKINKFFSIKNEVNFISKIQREGINLYVKYIKSINLLILFE